tara:strand:+ start:43 stop:729 length:687 start_codon:yes stop_codon:yes gene_type:complete
MHIILAVDIVNGKAVKAFAGIRTNYKPLHIKEEDFSNPIKLIQIFQKKINLKKIYIADLDAIRKVGNNDIIIEKILRTFPKLYFWIDAGFDYPKNVYNYHKKKIEKKLNNYELVLGTETMKNFNFKCFEFIKKCKISIDFNGKESYWLRKLGRQKHSMDIILMFVRQVGGRGVDMKVIRSLNKKLYFHKLSLAGGVKTYKQIQQLSKLGFCNVISSTFLHNRLSRDNL